MSQGGPLSSSGSGGGGVVETLTGNAGGAVGPDAAFNINILGSTGSGINVVGNPPTNTLTIVGLQATTSQRGTVFLATSAQAIAGSDTSNAVTSSALAAKLGAQTAHGLPIGAGTSSAITWTTVPQDGQLLIGSSAASPVLSTLTAGSGITITNSPGSITISGSGSASFNYTNVNTTPYAVLITDQYLSVDCSGSIISILLPNAPSTGRIFVIKDRTGSSATNNITVTTVGGAVTIDGATTYIMASNYQAIQLIFNGTSYEIF